MQRFVGSIILALVIAAVTAAIVIWRNRREIARAADQAAVSTLAAGVRASRRISGKAASYRQRVIEKADEPESRTPR